jgi:hypothetical protein
MTAQPDAATQGKRRMDRKNPPPHGLTGPRTYQRLDVPDVATCYDQVVAQLIARRHQLGWTQSDLDRFVGWQDGYAGKVEAPPDSPCRRRPKSSLFSEWLTALEVVLVAVPTDGHAEKAQRFAEVRAQDSLLDRAFAALRPLGLGLRVVPKNCVSNDLPPS